MKLSSIIQSFALFFFIITTLTCGYAVAGVNQIHPLAYELDNQQEIVPPPISLQQRQARSSFASVMNLALNGDMKAALPILRSVNLSDLSPKEQSAANAILANFDRSTPKTTDLATDEWLLKVVAAYQHYWSSVMLAKVSAEVGERYLAKFLASLVGMSGDIADMNIIEPELEKRIRRKGYFSLHGVTSPLREFMLWRSQQDINYEIGPSSRRSIVPVSMLDDFISFGWVGFATGNYHHTAGWATNERLFCVRKAYDLDSESFRVSYLMHEGQHFTDYKLFPDIQGPELEYRAKLVEIGHAEKTLDELLQSFSKRGSLNRENPHGYANRRLITNLKNALNVDTKENIWWKSIAPSTLRATALRLLDDDKGTIIINKDEKN